MKPVSFLGIVILAGAAALALFGAGMTTFGLVENLRSQEVRTVSLPELVSASGDVKEFQLMAKEPELNLECRPELMSDHEQSLPDFEIILVTDLPDRHAPKLVTFSGCPLTDNCTNRAAETY